MRQSKKKYGIHIGLITLLIIVTCLCVRPSQIYAAEKLCTLKTCEISSNGKWVSVKANLGKTVKGMGNKLYLMEFNNYKKIPKETVIEPVDSVRLLKGNVKFSTPLNNGKNNTKLFSKFAIAYKSGKKYKVISNVKYITNPEQVATYRSKNPVTYSKKGLQGENVTDAIKLGIQHAVINLTIHSVVSDQGTGEVYKYKGKNYYFNDNYLNYFDQQVHAYNEAGCKVTVILLLPNVSDPDIDAMRYNGGTAHYTGINTTTKEGARQFEAVMSYLAKRYGQKSHVVSGWILGNEIGNTADWNYGGGCNLNEYMDNYVRSFRICYTAAKSVNKNAQVYVSLDYNWNLDPDDGGNVYFTSKSILDTFHKKLKAEGITDWDIAYHAYSEGLIAPEFWDDTMAYNALNTPIVNFNNLSVLTNYVKDNYGRNVKVMLSEQSFNSNHGEMVQAAAYAYAYYIAESNDMVDYLIYGRHIDNIGEIDPTTGSIIGWGLLDTAHNRRALWSIFQFIDSPDGFHVTDPLIGYISTINSWKSIQGFDKNVYKNMPSKRSKVSGFKAKTQGYNRSRLNWNASEYASGYEIYRATSQDGKYKLIALPGADETSFEDGDVKSTKTYYYKIRCYHAFSSSSWYYDKYASAKVTVSLAPTSFTYAETYSEKISLKWNKATGASGYYVYRATSKDGKYTRIADVTGGSNVKYKDLGLKEGKTYYYKVVAYISKSDNIYKSTASDVISGIAGPRRVTLSTIIPGKDKLELQWKYGEGTSGYVIYISDKKDGEFRKIKTITDPMKLTYSITRERMAKEFKGPEYFFIIRPYMMVNNKKIYGSDSKVWSASLYDKDIVLEASRPTENNDGKMEVDLAWNKIKDASGYQIFRSEYGKDEYKKVKTLSDNDICKYTDQLDKSNKKWQYKIKIYQKTSAGNTVYGILSKAVTVEIMIEKAPPETEQSSELPIPSEDNHKVQDTEKMTDTEEPVKEDPVPDIEPETETKNDEPTTENNDITNEQIHHDTEMKTDDVDDKKESEFNSGSEATIL